MVVFLEKRIVLHSSLLQLHIDATAIYRNHLLDSAKTERSMLQVSKEEKEHWLWLYELYHLGTKIFANLQSIE